MVLVSGSPITIGTVADTTYNFAPEPAVRVGTASCTERDIVATITAGGTWGNLGAGATPNSGGSPVTTQYLPSVPATIGPKTMSITAPGNFTLQSFYTINTTPDAATPDVVVERDTICLGEVIPSITGTVLTGSNFIWEIRDPSNAVVLNQSGPTLDSLFNFTPASIGTYTVTLIIDSDCCGLTDPRSATFVVEPLPVVTVPPAVICIGDTAVLAPQSVVADFYIWDTPGGTVVTDTLTVSPSITTVYTVTPFTLRGGAAGCEGAPVNVTVTVNPKPVVTVNPTSATVCALNDTAFSFTGAVQYEIRRIGLPAVLFTGTAPNPATPFVLTLADTQAEGYSVTGISANGCVSDPVSFVLTVNPGGAPNTIGDRDICLGESTGILGQGGTDFFWSTVNNLNQAVNNPVSTNQLLIISSANFDLQGLPARDTCVYLFTRENGCLSLNGDSVCVTVWANPLPISGIPDTLGCARVVLRVPTASFNPLIEYTWTDLSGTLLSSDDSLVVTTPGYQRVILRQLTPAGCDTLDTVGVRVIETQPVTITGPNQVCEGQDITLTATGTPLGQTYNWSTLTGTALGTGISLTIPAATATESYVVTVEFSTDPAVASCITRDTFEVTVTALPLPVQPADTIGCEQVTLEVPAAQFDPNFIYTWEDLAGNPMGAGPDLLVTTGGYQQVVLVSLNPPNCEHRDTIGVRVIITEAVSIDGPASVCQGEDFTLTAVNAPNALSLTWFDDAGNQLAVGPTLSVGDAQATGTFIVVAEFSPVPGQQSCTQSDTVTVVVNPVPVLSIADEPFCDGFSVVMSAPDTLQNYVWTDLGTGVAITPTDPNRPFEIESSTGRTVVLTAQTNQGCFVTDTADFVLVDKPVIEGQDVQVCGGDTTALVVTRAAGTSAGGTYTWYSDAALTQVVQTGPDSTLVFEPLESSATFFVVYERGCESDPIELIATALGQPVIDFVRPSFPLDTTIKIRQSVTVGADLSTIGDPTNVTVTWNFGDATPNVVRTDGSNVTHTYNEVGTYFITIAVESPFGCQALDTVGRVVVELDEFLGPPNVFTPNGDGFNDFFDPQVKGFPGYTMLVWDRWGRQVFNNNGSENTLWNGRKDNSGEPCAEGVYFWQLIVDKNDGTKETRTGSVTLLR